MRRIKPVHIIVSENFYRELEKQRQYINSKVSKKLGFTKNVSLINVTDIIATSNPNFFRGRTNVKQKR